MYYRLDKKHESFDLFDSKLVQDIWKKKYFNEGETTVDEVFARVSNALFDNYPDVMSKEVDDSLTRADIRGKAYEAMKKGLFMPAGRILSGAGSERLVTLMNCYVGGTIDDSMEGIMDALKESALTMQQGGGIGNDFSTIRPKGALLRRTGSQASGPLYFMDLWDTMCSTIMSAGSRRGAMMGTLCDTHPDIVDFIKAKQQKGRLTNFNLSILVSDAFIKAVEDDSEWHLYFHEPKAGKPIDQQPVIQVTDVNGVTQTNYVYSVWSARELWKLITESTYEYSEPGVIFIDRINYENNLKDVETIRCTNPCGEQPLPPHGTCNLGAINLARIVRNPHTSEAYIDYKLLGELAKLGTRFLDSVIDVTNYPLEKQALEERNKRRLGLGFSGLADCLAQLRIPYGSEDSIIVAREIGRVIAVSAYRESHVLSKEFGSFPLFDSVEEQKFLDYLDEETKALCSEGMRNGLLLTVAPTGTTSIAFGNVSSGLEPVFAHSIERRVRTDSVDNLEEYDTYTEWGFGARFYRHCQDDNETTIPAYMNTMSDLTLDDHLYIHSACQEFVDASVSKTINCPEEMTYEEFLQVYEAAYEAGCKGCTTYRPSDVRGSILSVNTGSKKEEPIEPIELVERGEVLEGYTYKIKWPTMKSSIYVTINHKGDLPYEVFFSSKDSQNSEWMTGLTLMISALLRVETKLSFIGKELRSIVSAHDSAWIGEKHYHSLVAKVGDVLYNHAVNVSEDVEDDTPVEKCPECSTMNLVSATGCKTCVSCGYSACG